MKTNKNQRSGTIILGIYATILLGTLCYNKINIEENKESKKMCCKALTASCMACTNGISIKEFCKNNPKVNGCSSY